MLRHVPLVSTLALAAIVAVACTEASDPTAPFDPGAALFSPDAPGPPANSGPYVLRFERTATFLIVDPRTEVGLYLGADIVRLCSGDPSGFDAVSIQDVHVPEDENRINELVRGEDVRASLWNPFPVSCADVLSRAPAATGTVDFVSTDNDVDVFLNPESRNANAFGVQAHGFLETGDGDVVGVNA